MKTIKYLLPFVIMASLQLASNPPQRQALYEFVSTLSGTF